MRGPRRLAGRRHRLATSAIGIFLPDQQVVPPAAESERVAGLLELPRARPCLLLLDHFETPFEPPT